MTCKKAMEISSVVYEEPCRVHRCCKESIKEDPKEMGEKAKCELIGYDSLPDYLKDNEFILRYYRCEWPLKQTILSIFSVHNETLNVWTHLVGFLFFLALTVFTAMMVPRDEIPHILHSSHSHCLRPPLSGNELSDWKFPQILLNFVRKCMCRNILSRVKDDVMDMVSPLLVKPITRWPLITFLCGAMFCLLTSSVCHLVSCHSRRTSYFMLRLDYTGITALIVTSFYPVTYYPFMCSPFFGNLYMGFITAFGVATVLVSFVPVFQTSEFRPVRAVLFSCMGLSGLVPITHKLAAFSDRPEAVLSAGYEMLMGVFYGLGVVVYATRVPERWKPGKFDLVGNSHQLFHLLVIAGAYAHYLAGLVYLEWRDSEKC